MKIIVLILLVLLTVSTAFAQRQADNWLFGEGAGVSFRNGSATPISGRMNTQEGCASISDKKNGQLLFYTNGDTVWNANGSIINKGLFGGESSSQSAIIVPIPNQADQYYIITAPDLTSGANRETGMFYSIVKIQPDNWPPVIIQKNVSLLDDACERIACTQDFTKTGYWVVVQHRTKFQFYAYHITAFGIGNPVISSFQPPNKIPVNDRDAGCMKISPNGKKLATSTAFMGYLYLFDFDNSTGNVSNILDLLPLPKPTSPPVEAYGLSFSPDNSKLYCFHRIENALTADLSQFEVNSNDRNFILKSKVLINDPTEEKMRWAWRSMQIAPDGKIYCTRNGFPILSAIRSPNLKGNACDFHETEVQLLSKGLAGLPGFVDSWFNTEVSDTTVYQKMTDTVICFGTSVRIGLQPVKDITYSWLPKETLDNPNVPMPIATPFVTTTYYRNSTNPQGQSTIDSITISVDKPVADAGEDKIVCKENSVTSVQIGSSPKSGYAYSWTPANNLDNPNLSNPTVTSSKSEKYIVTATSPFGCMAFDTVLVSMSGIVSNVSPDTTVCKGTSIQLSASGGSIYSWLPSKGLTNSSIANPVASPDSTTRYTVYISNGLCIDSAFVTITVNPLPTADAGPDRTSCKGETVQLGVTAQSGTTYSWQPIIGLDNPTKSNPQVTPVKTTEYILTVTNTSGCEVKDTVVVNVVDFNIKVSENSEICTGGSTRLAASGGDSYKWSPSIGLDNPDISNPIASPITTTTYRVVVTNGFCVDSASITVTVLLAPIAYAGQDRIGCEGDSLYLGAPPQIKETYSWQPTTGLDNPTISNPIARPIETTQYILSVTNSVGCNAKDTVVVTVNSKDERLFTLSPNTIPLYPGQPFKTNLIIPGGVDKWKVTLSYNKLIMKYASILEISSGLTAVVASESNGQLTIHGTGENGSVLLDFYTYLPYNLDTSFVIDVIVDSAIIDPCDRITTRGSILKLAEYCGRTIRNVSSTDKNYYMSSKGNGVSFGLGLTGNITMELYNYTGTIKEVLFDKQMEAGEYSLDFDMPTGVYFCRMTSGMYNEVVKIISVK